jgi:hypothetical protein
VRELLHRKASDAQGIGYTATGGHREVGIQGDDVFDVMVEASAPIRQKARPLARKASTSRAKSFWAPVRPAKNSASLMGQFEIPYEVRQQADADGADLVVRYVNF